MSGAMTNGLPLLSDEEIERHAYSLELSGYAILRNQLTPDEIALYRAACEDALNAHVAQFPPETPACLAGCLYAWDERTLAILEHENMTRLTTVFMGKHKLFNVGALVVLPESRFKNRPTKEQMEASGEYWHRDFAPVRAGSQLKYLWHFVCLCDVDSHNGATWLVPGTNRESERFTEPEYGKPKAFPNAFQFDGKAGDVFVIDPTNWHEAGMNYSDEVRWIMEVGYCSVNVETQRDHWRVAGPRLQPKLSGRALELIRSARKPDETFEELAVPNGWQFADD